MESIWGVWGPVSYVVGQWSFSLWDQQKLFFVGTLVIGVACGLCQSIKGHSSIQWGCEEIGESVQMSRGEQH